MICFASWLVFFVRLRFALVLLRWASLFGFVFVLFWLCFGFDWFCVAPFSFRTILFRVLLCVTPFDLVWFGLVWFGLVWFGLVWFGLVRFGLVWFGLVWFGLVWFGSVRFR